MSNIKNCQHASTGKSAQVHAPHYRTCETCPLHKRTGSMSTFEKNALIALAGFFVGALITMAIASINMWYFGC